MLAALLIACVLVVGFWEFMSNRSHRPLSPFLVTEEDFSGLEPSSAAFVIRRLPVNRSPIEPNILAFEVRSGLASDGRAVRLDKAEPLMVRVVHGYNMPDCMRIRGYDAALIRDQFRTDRPGANQASPSDVPVPRGRIQLWRLTSDLGDRHLWASSMIRASDGVVTDGDTRDMPFPRIGTPDDPNWVPRGLHLSSFRHPIRNFRLFLRSRWNSSRSDLATFLRLKQPVWASDELLTVITASYAVVGRPEEEEEIGRQVLLVHAFFLDQLEQWGRTRSDAAGQGGSSRAPVAALTQAKKTL